MSFILFFLSMVRKDPSIGVKFNGKLIDFFARLAQFPHIMCLE